MPCFADCASSFAPRGERCESLHETLFFILLSGAPILKQRKAVTSFVLFGITLCFYSTLTKKPFDGDMYFTFCSFRFRLFHCYSVLLLPLDRYPEEFRHLYSDAIFDLDMKDDLERSKVINWCRTTRPLYPVKTTGKILDFMLII